MGDPLSPDRITGGCLVTGACWAFAGLAMLGTMMGDCFPDAAHRCPTDHERNMALLAILLGTFTINAGLIYLINRFGSDGE